MRRVTVTEKAIPSSAPRGTRRPPAPGTRGGWTPASSMRRNAYFSNKARRYHVDEIASLARAGKAEHLLPIPQQGALFTPS